MKTTSVLIAENTRLRWKAEELEKRVVDLQREVGVLTRRLETLRCQHSQLRQRRRDVNISVEDEEE